ncbi:hypothetical protein B0H14DRAFT_3007574 [Mycena olivaceomarginata]|nr:hypothetical protein B0H14DRAFT_3007574 [Mycena olivaceomarginata]
MAEELPSTDLITLTRHVLQDQLRLGAAATGDLTLLLTAIQVTSKSLRPIVGLAGETNIQGEEQKKLDILSNDIMVNALRASGKTSVLVSEELEDAIIIEEKNKGKYCVVFDPLDGSSNIDAGLPTHFLQRDGSKGGIEDVLRPGSEMVAAGYTMYGSSANLVLSTGSGGEFILTHPDIKIPPRGKIYSFNEGNSMYFHPPVTHTSSQLKYPAATENALQRSVHWVHGCRCASHPTVTEASLDTQMTKKSKNGKLRLLYEAFPMAFLTEQRILDIVPTGIHERKEDVQDLMKCYE